MHSVICADLLLVCHSESDNDIGEHGNVVFIHQSRWQCRMLQLYGSDMCLTDATYRTTSYGLSLLCLCVATNVGYYNVTSILLVDETCTSISAALRTPAEWNPEWSPRYVMSDFNEAQISAVESTFPGYFINSYIYIQCTAVVCTVCNKSLHCTTNNYILVIRTA